MTTPEEAATKAWAKDPMGEIRESIRCMKARLEAGLGKEHQAMCRLPLYMAEHLLKEIGWLEEELAGYHNRHQRLSPDEHEELTWLAKRLSPDSGESSSPEMAMRLAELTLQLDGVKTKGMAPRWGGEIREKLGERQ